ncbi:MAG: class I mannose-6-phosphate isomerase [Bacteroidetes bacterium]|nr:class I mannose-6-phosphate isomerase [Bacteroidota bacterium]
MNTLYPLKFKPIYKEKIWGGSKIKTLLNKNISDLQNCGESWEISGVEENISMIENGFLKNNNLQEIIEVYMGDIVGDAVYEKFGNEFPLLIKFIDANDNLSVQVHPNDELAKERHSANGKTEMWYIINAEKGAQLISGFNNGIDKNIYLKNLKNNTLTDILNFEDVSNNDVFFIPAGRVHATGKGILLAEIQQTSDVTYRIFDWNRKDSNGKSRELHTDLAIDALDFSHHNDYKTEYTKKNNESSKLIDCQYFTTNILEFDKELEKDYNLIDSFVIYMCIEGSYSIKYNENDEINISKGETVLLPAVIENVSLIPCEKTKILEVYLSFED